MKLPPIITVNKTKDGKFIAQFIGPRNVPWRGPIRESEEQARKEWAQEYLKLSKRFGW